MTNNPAQHPPATQPPAPAKVALTRFAARAGDHNDLAMIGSAELAAGLADAFDATPYVVGRPQPALAVDWVEELAAARSALHEMATRLDTVLRSSAVPVTALSRCAVALATLPVLAAHRPDAVVVWFDAHADLNTPDTTTTGYLGGLALSGPLGWWDSGMGGGLDPAQIVLVGARDIDAAEQALLDASDVTLVEPGPNLPDRLRAAVANRRVYVHVDCDVLEPGAVPTDYRVPGGLSLQDLHAAMTVLAESEVVGVEIGELESAPDNSTPPAYVSLLLDALDPVLQAAARGPRKLATGVTIAATPAGDPGLARLTAAQEAEVMARYGVADAGPGLTTAAVCLLANLDGQPIGCVGVEPHGQTGELKRMYVEPSARGHGIGRRLLEAAEQAAADLGCTALRLETGTEQPEALALYESAGWTHIPRYGYFRDDPTTICLEKPVLVWSQPYERGTGSSTQ